MCYSNNWNDRELSFFFVRMILTRKCQRNGAECCAAESKIMLQIHGVQKCRKTSVDRQNNTNG